MAISVSQPVQTALGDADRALSELLVLELSWTRPGDQIGSIDAAVRLRAKLDASLCETPPTPTRAAPPKMPATETPQTPRMRLAIQLARS